ncbi:PLAT domain-containing protein [Caerostris darwini]|uniref:PLAT domain-containing protein n=1 Tax=Caerostris darwini TaxID=1538125 RepID=A0AAV4UAK6_9ARAC|nr:PLAT domain-containing protein [Caerostris darwini]
MGRIWSRPEERELTVHVLTGDRKRAGTDANVWLILYDEKGQATESFKLNRTLHNDHERGATCTFFFPSGVGFGQPMKQRPFAKLQAVNYDICWNRLLPVATIQNGLT